MMTLEEPAASAGEDAVALWLFDDLLDTLSGILGSPERDQIVELMRCAEVIRLAPAVTSAIQQTISQATSSIAGHVGKLDVGIAPLWVEYAVPDGTGSVAGHIQTIGFLVSTIPDTDRHTIGFVAWRTHGGAIYHSYGILHWNGPGLDQAALSADPLDGLMEAVVVSVPARLRDEMVIWHAPSSGPLDLDAALDQTRRAALAENIFILTACLLLCTAAVDIIPKEGGPRLRATAVLRPTKGRTLRWMRPTLPSGFSVAWNGTLRWTPPRR